MVAKDAILIAQLNLIKSDKCNSQLCEKSHT